MAQQSGWWLIASGACQLRVVDHRHESALEIFVYMSQSRSGIKKETLSCFSEQRYMVLHSSGSLPKALNVQTAQLISARFPNRPFVGLRYGGFGWKPVRATRPPIFGGFLIYLSFGYSRLGSSPATTTASEAPLLRADTSSAVWSKSPPMQSLDGPPLRN